MAGHSKWAQIKHKKARMDQRRGKLFTKLIREITVAAKMGGPNPDANPRLRSAIEVARSYNMPNANIERAIKRATGGEGPVNLEEVSYEGYGPGKVAILVETLTDNRNRTTSEIRHVFSKYGGNLGSSGCVSWLFHNRGIFLIDRNEYDEDRILDLAVDSGAIDFKVEGSTYQIITKPEDFHKFREILKKNNIQVIQAELTKIPQSTVRIEDARNAERVLKLFEQLDSLDEVQHVYANFDIPEEIMEKFSEGD
ncbi:YebC/PmpR family DNA-binding transcriptional regulator [candidate division WOR-3 bacterium]|mgnify:CR=1 FL=1|uniref:Probable transcriptional regulatory protein DRP53_06175 n=1 Tax=candidate division WOR-3 bacterium TaxID=2052148 RepID=A0A660SHN5_UNCW3|nr:MAG: YebC/PmpR family DNA-binding transcriptional regulator [candidate division WOR-3 bacterium]